MTTQHGRRGVAFGIAALTGLTAAALGVVGVADHVDADAQRDVALVNAADVAHTNLLDGQVAMDHAMFQQDVLGLQGSIYYWTQEATTNGGLGLTQVQADKMFMIDSTASPADTNLFNGAFTRFFEAQEVGQAIQQAQLDHMLGVNQSIPGGGVPGGYETAIGTALHSDMIGSGITPGGTLATDLAALQDPTVLDSASGFHDALVQLQGDLMSTAWNDFLGGFSSMF